MGKQAPNPDFGISDKLICTLLLGAGLGIVLGVALHDLELGLNAGVSIGACIGAVLDWRQGRTH